MYLAIELLYPNFFCCNIRSKIGGDLMLRKIYWADMSYSLLDTLQLWLLKDGKLKHKENGEDEITLNCNRCNWKLIQKSNCQWQIKNEGKF